MFFEKKDCGTDKKWDPFLLNKWVLNLGYQTVSIIKVLVLSLLGKTGLFLYTLKNTPQLKICYCTPRVSDSVFRSKHEFIDRSYRSSSLVASKPPLPTPAILGILSSHLSLSPLAFLTKDAISLSF